jgi:apolipoprotein D and lipocalin family protein
MKLALLLSSLITVALGLVPTLNQTAYLGHWFQVYSDLIVEATFENASFCVTADYGTNSNGTISVLNRERQGSSTGPERRVLGWAAQSGQPGQLTVHLQTAPFPAPYWVYALGPQTYNGSLYEWSVVSDPLKATLFVLVRNLSTFENRWEDDILSFLAEEGFTETWNAPIPTIQDGCW